jgi:hypothetical protein
MDAEKQDQQALQALLAQAQEALDRLVGDLRAVDGELDAISTERQQYQLLHDVCGALEQLSQLGGAELFWGDRAAVGSGEQRLRHVRGLVTGFEKQLGEIEERRQIALEAVMRQQEDTDWLAGDVLEAQEEEEKLAQEWVIEREIGDLPAHPVMMPWTRGGEDDARFRRSAWTHLAIMLLLALVIPHVEIPIFEPDELPAMPERVVRLVQKPLPPPPKEVAPQVPEEKPIVAETTVPEPAKKTGAGKGPGEGPSQGPGKGLLAFKEQLSGIKVNQQLARLGAEARVTNAGAASGVVERSMISSSAPGSSGGINLASLSRGVNAGGSGGGASGIAGVQIARATSNIAGGGGGRGDGGKGVGSGAVGGRSDEEIQIVFDRHKAELYRLYNRELRRDPTLRGQMILRLRIEPDGSVTLCELRGSDMRAPDLAAQVVARVRGFDFGAKENIGPVTILYPIDFLPAA